MQREIALPLTHNKRAPTQWSIISPHVDFRGKTVLDLGCGYADLLWRSLQAGAASAVGIDHDLDIIQHNNRVLREQVSMLPAYFLHEEIEAFIAGFNVGMGEDVILCFSVLPYLDDPVGVLEWIHDHSRIALLEVQYSGDGPGPVDLQDNRDMKYQLELAGWSSPTPIGSTYIPDRDRHRTIWLCENKEIL